MGEIDGAKTNRHGEAPNRDDPWQIGHLPNAGDAFYRCRGVIPALGSKGRRNDGISAAMGEDGGMAVVSWSSSSSRAIDQCFLCHIVRRN